MKHEWHIIPPSEVIDPPMTGDAPAPVTWTIHEVVLRVTWFLRADELYFAVLHEYDKRWTEGWISVGVPSRDPMASLRDADVKYRMWDVARLS